MVSLTSNNLYFGSPGTDIITKKPVFLNNLNPQEVDSGKEDVNILDPATSEVICNFIGLFDDNQQQGN